MENKKEGHKKKRGERALIEVDDSSKYFYFFDNSYAKNLAEMIHKIRLMNDDWFSHYVNENKNDFANWVRYCLNNDFLADELVLVKNKQEMIKILEDHLEDEIEEEKEETHPLIEEAIKKSDKSLAILNDTELQKKVEPNEDTEKLALQILHEIKEAEHIHDPVMPLWKVHLNNLLFLLVFAYILILVIQLFVVNPLITKGVAMSASMVFICCAFFYHKKILKNNQGSHVVSWLVDFVAIVAVLVSFVYSFGDTNFAWNLFPWFMAIVSLFILNLVASHT